MKLQFLLTINEDGSVKVEPYTAPAVSPTISVTPQPVVVAPPVVPTLPSKLIIGTNLEEVVDWMADRPFLNLAIQSAPWHSGTSSVWNDGGKIPLNADESIAAIGANQIAYKVISTSERPAGTYIACFRCFDSDVETLKGLVKNATYDKRMVVGTNTSYVYFKMNVPATGNLYLQLGPSTTPVSFSGGLSLSEFALEVNLATTEVNPLVLNPDFVKEVNRYSGIRLMDWQQTNTTKSSRAKKAFQPTEIANVSKQLKLDKLWLNLHHEDLITKTHSLLTTDYSAAEILIENSNEVWNSMFPVYKYAAGNSPLPTGTEFDKAMNWHANRTAQLSNNITNPKMKVVLGAWHANPYWTGQLLQQVKNAGGSKVDYVAIAPYFGHTLNTATEATLMSLAKAAVDTITLHINQIKSSPFPTAKIALYEFGQHLIPGIEDNKDEKMFRIYQYFMAELEKVIGKDGIAFHFTKTGNYTKDGSWGESSKFGDFTTPKSRALELYKK